MVQPLLQVMCVPERGFEGIIPQKFRLPAKDTLASWNEEHGNGTGTETLIPTCNTKQDVVHTCREYPNSKKTCHEHIFFCLSQALPLLYLQHDKHQRLEPSPPIDQLISTFSKLGFHWKNYHIIQHDIIICWGQIFHSLLLHHQDTFQPEWHFP